MTTVAIVGAGFSGTVLAARLLQAATALHVVLVHRSRSDAQANSLGRGLAYGTQSDAHLLNVPTGRMSAFAEDEDSFLRYLRDTGHAVTGGSFVARHRYGAYLGACLERAVQNRTAGASFTLRRGEAVDLQRTGERTRLLFDDGSTLDSDQVVLALGNFAPSDPKLADAGLYSSSRYLRDPWSPGAIEKVDRSQPVLLLGTGLTMFDVAQSLAADDPKIRLIAISRRGALPHSHRSVTHAPDFSHAPAAITTDAPTARAYLYAVRAEVTRLAKQGIDWREVIASLRPLTSQLWQRLPPSERTRFLRHLRPYWDVHRHRAAPETAAAMQRLIASGQLQVRAARLVDGRDAGDGLHLSIRLRGTAHLESLTVGAVINCTGPTSDFRAAGERLLCRLEARGDIVQDDLHLGIEIDADGHILDRHGRPQPDWHCIGPLRKARDWEAVAVPELREQAREVAAAIVNSIAAKP